MHPTQYTFGSASADNIKQWKCPEGEFIQVKLTRYCGMFDFKGQKSITFALTISLFSEPTWTQRYSEHAGSKR